MTLEIETPRKKKNGSAAKTKKKKNGSAAERVAEVAENAQARNDCVDRLNENYAVVRMGGDTVILHEQPDQPPQFMSVAALHLWFANDRVAVRTRTGTEMVPVSRWWIKNKRRRQYERVVFDPTDKDPQHFNLWHGFPVQPDASKSCEKFLAHIRDNICSGNEDHYQWVIGWLAHMIQRPEEKSGAALVLRGQEGVGKGFLANYLGRLCPQHYVVVSQATHLTGRFNPHHQQALLIFVDEGFWAGDKVGEGALKHLVTDPELLIEPKHVNPFMVRNLSRLIIVSNEHWVVPAGTRARRWFVLDVADTHANDRKYFGDIAAEMEAGGLAALMHLLMTFDLSTVDIYTTPKTAALLEQKEESAAPHERWWLQCLQEGEFRYRDDSGFTADTDGWPAEIQKDRLWESYQSWVKEHNIRARLWPSEQLHKWLRPLMPGSHETRPRGGDRKRMVVLPSLTTCREAYDHHVAQSVAWEDTVQEYQYQG
jgi:hypothetical protein